MLALLALSSSLVRAQGLAPDRELVVATKEAAPFAMKQTDGNWGGISIELWKRIADGAHLHFRVVETQSVQDLLDGVAKGNFDVGVAAITVTAARARSVDFTQPFYNTGLGIAVPINESTWVAIARALFSFGFFQAVAALLCFAMAVGFLIWLLERRKTEHFSGGARGLGSSFWWSAIAMTQAGAAQNAPTTLPGRIVAVGWMIASVIAIAVFTAGITSTLTRRELQGAVHSFNDLRSVRVGAVANSATSDYLTQMCIRDRASTAKAMRSCCQRTAHCGRCSISPCLIKSKVSGGNRRCSRPLEMHGLASTRMHRGSPAWLDHPSQPPVCATQL
ncbi:transporter substrate-binding domain-containing protein [Bradyrhizobium sp. UFLA05-112]